MKIEYIDIHSHIHGHQFDEDRGFVLRSMQENGVATIAVGTGKETSAEAVACAAANEQVYATVGLHPADDAKEEFEAAVYETLAAHPKVVAIGECGLDYHYIETFFEKDKEEKGLNWNKDAEADRQQRFFIEQIDLAAKLDKPLMLHGRPSPRTTDAYEDMCHILRSAQQKYGEKVRGNFHFFVGDLTIAKQVLDLGFTVSFPGVITFTTQYDEVVRHMPIDRIHGETDSPYAAPKPFRGERNTPNNVREIYKHIAHLRGEDEEKVRLQLLQNARSMFGIALQG